MLIAIIFPIMAVSQTNSGSSQVKENPVEITAAFWDFETGFADLLENIETTSGDGFVIFDDPDRGNVLEMPGGQSAESSLVYGDAGGITGNTPRLLKFWIKAGKLDSEGNPIDPDNDNDLNNGVITNWGVNSNGERFTVRISNGNQMRIEVQGGFAQTTDDVIFPHQWHHVIIHVADVDDATTDDISIWVDGVSQPVSAGTRVLDTQPGEFAFGWNSVSGRTLFGYIDDFFMMNQAPVYAGDGDNILILYSGSGEATDVSGSGFYDEGDVVALQATAPAGYAFTNWTYPDGTVASTDANFDFTMPNDNVILVANFDVPLYDLTLEVNPEDAGTVTGAGSYPPFSEVTINATPNLGYTFVNWIDEDGIEVSDLALYVFDMPEDDVTLTANFEEVENFYTLTLAVLPEDAGTTTGAGEYEEGESVLVSALPETGFYFVQWQDEDGVTLSELPEFDFTMPAADVTLTAVFSEMVPVTQAFWNFNDTENGFTDILQQHTPTQIGAGFQLTDDADRGQVLDMPGGNEPEQAFVFGNSTGITGNQPRLIMFWMKQGKEGQEPDNINDINNGVITSWGINDAGERFTVRASNQSQMRVEIQGSFAQTVDDVLELHTWHHVIIQLDDAEEASTDQLTIWVDGIERPTSTGSQDVIVNTAESPFGFGFNQLPGRNLFGYIDNFLILDYAPGEDKIFGLEETTIADDLGIELDYPGMYYELTLLANPNEGGSVTGEGMQQHGSEVTVSAVPNEGFIFVNWTDSDQQEVSDEAEFTFVMPDADYSLTANFEEGAPETFALTLLASPEDGGIVSGAGEYEQGEEVMVNATSNEGFAFVNWTLEDDIVSTDAAFTYTMPAADVTLTAHFEEETPDIYTLTLEADPAEGGTVDGAGEYEEGTIINVTASPADNYIFLNWVDIDGNEVSTDATFDFTMPAEDITLVAQFDLENFAQEPEETIVNLFPNPARELFTITAGSIINEVIITDITGKVVFNNKVNNTEIQIRKPFESGIYIIRIYTQEGIAIEKLQIQK